MTHIRTCQFNWGPRQTPDIIAVCVLIDITSIPMHWLYNKMHICCVSSHTPHPNPKINSYFSSFVSNNFSFPYFKWFYNRCLNWFLPSTYFQIPVWKSCHGNFYEKVRIQKKTLPKKDTLWVRIFIGDHGMFCLPLLMKNFVLSIVFCCRSTSFP